MSGCAPRLNELAQQQHMPVWRAADMASILIDKGLTRGMARSSSDSRSPREAPSSLGNGKAAQAAEPIIQRPRAPLIKCQTASLNN